MRHLIDPATKEIYAYAADGSDDAFIKPRLVPISDAELAALRAATVDPAGAIRQQIAELEASVTPRRLREAVLTGDHSFVDSIDKQIAALRAAI